MKRNALFLISCLIAACIAHQQVDPRAQEIHSIERTVISADSAFAAYYIVKSNAIIESIKKENGTSEDYVKRIKELNAQQEYISSLLKEIKYLLKIINTEIKNQNKVSNYMLRLRKLNSKLANFVLGLDLKVYL